MISPYWTGSRSSKLWQNISHKSEAVKIIYANLGSQISRLSKEEDVNFQKLATISSQLKQSRAHLLV